MIMLSKMTGLGGGAGIFISLNSLLLASTFIMDNAPLVQSFTPTSTRIHSSFQSFTSPTIPHDHRITTTSTSVTTSATTTTSLRLSDWSDFEALDEFDDDDDYLNDPNGQPVGGFADENDDPERKAEVGSSLPCPEVFWDGDPIFMPQGETLPLTEENVQGLLAACRIEIGTMFGYTAENRGVGITGGVDYVEMDGPNVVVTLKGRFWHQRPTVLKRVGAYIMGRIPEVVDVIVWDEEELSDEVNNAAV